MPIPLPVLDFPSRAFPSLLSTPTGQIKYWTDPYGYSENFQTAGATSKVKLYVLGTDAADFIRYSLGYTARYTTSSLGGGGGSVPVGLSRVVPMTNPFFPFSSFGNVASQYLSGLEFDRGGRHSNDVSNNNWPDWDWICYSATFSTRNYDVIPDSSAIMGLSGVPIEITRYVTRIGRPSGRERKVPAFALETAETPPLQIAEVGFVIDRTVDWVYTWHQVPAAAYPRDAVANQIGTVNQTQFDGYGYGQTIGTPFPVGTMLFRGLGRDLEPYIGRDGGIYYDIVYLFTQRALGWNNYIRPNGTTVAWRYKRVPGYSGPDIPPYQTSEFLNLFAAV